MSMIRTYTETYDMNTEASCPTLLGIHTPIGSNPYTFLWPAFAMYRKYKYLGCDVTVVNASHLPISPEAFAIEGGTSNVDPRDMLNPIMFKGCHGDSLGDILDSMYGGLTSDIFKGTDLDKEKLSATLSNFYYTALGDSSWRKSNIQKTLRINNLHPLVYQLATNLQILPSNNIDYSKYIENLGVNVTGNTDNFQIGSPANGGQNATTAARLSFDITPGTYYDPVTGNYVNRVPQSMFTSHTRPLGWIDTQQIAGNKSQNIPFDPSKVAQLPKIFMGMLMLPPANRAYTYLRVIIRHKFAFKEYRTITTGGQNSGTDVTQYSYGYADKYTGGITDDLASSRSLVQEAPSLQEMIDNGYSQTGVDF